MTDELELPVFFSHKQAFLDKGNKSGLSILQTDEFHVMTTCIIHVGKMLSMNTSHEFWMKLKKNSIVRLREMGTCWSKHSVLIHFSCSGVSFWSADWYASWSPLRIKNSSVPAFSASTLISVCSSWNFCVSTPASWFKWAGGTESLQFPSQRHHSRRKRLFGWERD